MKKITTLFALAITLLSLNTVFAQNSTRTKSQTEKVKGVKPVNKLTTEQKAKQGADSLKARLSLTDMQYQKVIAINTDYFKSRDELRKKMKSDTTENTTYKTDFKELQATRKKQISTLLTPEQKKTWAAWHKEHKANNMKGERMKTNDTDIDAIEE